MSRDIITEAGLEKFRKRLAVMAWRSYVRRLIGVAPPRAGPIPTRKKDIDRMMHKTGHSRSEIVRLIEHVEALRPDIDAPKMQWPGEFADDSAFRERAMGGIHPLRLYRLARGLPMTGFGKVLGVHWTTAYRYEVGKVDPTITKARKLCEFLGVQYESFLAAWGKWASCRMRFAEGDDDALMDYFRYIEEGMNE